MDYSGVGGASIFHCLVFVIIFPVMWEVFADQDNVAWSERFDMIANELCSIPFVKTNEFYFFMIMPGVIDIWYDILSYAERMVSLIGYC